jgi:hypothetical protein
MKIKNILHYLLLWAIAGATAHGQVATDVWYRPGTCSDAGTFVCDHVTVAHLKDGKTLLQFTAYASHYESLVGTADSEDPTLIDLEASYLDGLPLPHAINGQCVLIFKAPGQLEQIICPGLKFKVTEGSSK